MPIKKENRSLYPPNWKVIRAEVLERAGNKCEKCGVENYAVGVRDLSGKFWSTTQFENGEVEICNADFEKDGGDLKKSIRIVLTIAHVNHDPTDNGETGNRPNLLVLCQKDHLNLDAGHHAINSRKTRDGKLGRIALEF